MSTVTIEGPDRAAEAAYWAKENIHDHWRLDVSNIFSDQYGFVFDDPQDASFFALKWL